MAEPSKKALAAAIAHAKRAAITKRVPYCVFKNKYGDLLVKAKSQAPPDTDFIFDTDNPEETSDAP